MAAETVTLDGHIIDSLLLAKVLDLIVDAGATYDLHDVTVGRTATDASSARIDITMDEESSLAALLEELHVHGANVIAVGDADTEPAPADGVLPAGFYSSTNLSTEVHIGGGWITVSQPEMDCAVIVTGINAHPSRGNPTAPTARTVPMHRVLAGEHVVVGRAGVRVTAPAARRRANGAAVGSSFEFMASEVSSEKPKALLLERVAARLRAARHNGGRVLWVCGPALIHTGAGPALASLVEGGWVDVLFTGNGFATHDMESNVLGTSLGVSVQSGSPTEGGHANHLRVINEIRRHGSIAAAVDAGYVTGGVMAACVANQVPFVLAGSVRDDGPLPDTIRDVVAAADRMRGHLAGVEVAVMVATTLHAIATGNILPASVETFCVDINQAVVTKLADRGSRQALGIVTDAGLFVRDLAALLADD